MIFQFEKISLFIILLLVAISCTSEKDADQPQMKLIQSDAEMKIEVLGKKYLKANGMNTVSGGGYQSSEMAHSGEYSVKLGDGAKYAFQHKFTDIKADMFIRAYVWRYGGHGNLALTSLAELKFEEYSSQVVETDSLGWELLMLESFVPANYSGEELKLFIMNHRDEISYFDDLRIEIYEAKPYPNYDEIDNIDLIIDPLVLEEINKHRIKSFNNGIISKKTKQKFPAIFKYGEKELEAEIRVKGDWLDHLQGDKWSYRVKLKEGNFKGMKEFSVQQPGARGYLNEYVIHHLFITEDVLTPRYGFVPLKINGEGRGIYAYEEHFAKHLVESRNRREGPILKFDESGLWEINLMNLYKKEGYVSGPVVEASLITPFKKSKTSKNPVLKENFIIGQNLLNQYKKDEAPISDLFKTESLAAFYAILNISRSWHATRWHNERYYYDPISSKLEIIAFDCFTASKSEPRLVLSPQVINQKKDFDYDTYLAYSPFNDPLFFEEYMDLLDTYVNTDHISSIIADDDEEIELYNDLIRREYIHYTYDKDFIQSAIDILHNDWDSIVGDLAIQENHAKLVIEEYNRINEEPLDGLNLNAYSNGQYSISVQNFHNKDLFITAYSSKKLPEQGIVNLAKAVKVRAYTNLADLETVMVDCKFSPSTIYYKRQLDDTISYKKKVNAWPLPESTSPRQELLSNSDLESFPFLIVKDSLVLFLKGKHQVKRPLVIPNNMHVVMGEGVELNFIEKAFFMSFSPLQLKGTQESPVKITSSDNSAMGFTIIDASIRSTIDHVIFDGFNTLAYKGWNLTGAVSFYQSDVDIINSQFLNNKCEDGLNIIRSDFSMRNSRIFNAMSDGFDADFATGLVQDSEFEKIGNDGIDFSGSEIKIKDVQIREAGDKGVSGGEGSTMYLENILVESSNIGIASKDRSLVYVDGVEILNTYCAFAVYQKKMEYEPAQLHVKGAKLNGIDRDDLIGSGSILIIDGKEIEGTEKVNLDSLYNL